MKKRLMAIIKKKVCTLAPSGAICHRDRSLSTASYRKNKYKSPVLVGVDIHRLSRECIVSKNNKTILEQIRFPSFISVLLTVSASISGHCV